MNIHKLTPYNQTTGLDDSSLASAELKILSKAESTRHNRSERKRTVRFGRNCKSTLVLPAAVGQVTAPSMSEG